MEKIYAKVIFYGDYTQPILEFKDVDTFCTDIETALMLLAKNGKFDRTRLLIEILAEIWNLQIINKNRFVYVAHWGGIKPSSIILDNKRRSNIIIDVTYVDPEEDYPCTRGKTKDIIKNLLKKEIEKDLCNTKNKNVLLEIGQVKFSIHREKLPPNFNNNKAIIVRNMNGETIIVAEHYYDNPKAILFINANKIKEKFPYSMDGIVKNMFLNFSQL